MTVTQNWGWQGLWRQMSEYGGGDWAEDVLLPYVERHPELVAQIHDCGDERMAYRRIGDEISWGLYALSRVFDALIGPLQPECPPERSYPQWARELWTHRLAGAETFEAFADALSLTSVAGAPYQPFLHEVVAVQPAGGADAPAEIVEELWPAKFAGALLVVRGGVVARAGADLFDLEVMAASALYWSWWRRYRESVDLSYGWGSSSQWRTEWRRDYVTDGRFLYNVDYADGPPAWWIKMMEADPRDELSSADMFDLVRHRCSTTVDLGPEQWPWYTYAEEPCG